MRRIFSKALPDSQSQYRKKQSGYEIAGSHDFVTRHCQFVPQLVRSIPAAMLQRRIVLAPQKAISRNSDEHQPSLLRHTMDFPKRPQVIVSVLQNVQGRQDIKRAASKRQFLDMGKGYRLNAALVAKAQRFDRIVDPNRIGESSKGVDVRARAASDIENA